MTMNRMLLMPNSVLNIVQQRSSMTARKMSSALSVSKQSHSKKSPGKISASSLFKRGTATPTNLLPVGIQSRVHETPPSTDELSPSLPRTAPHTTHKSNARPDLSSPLVKVSSFNDSDPKRRANASKPKHAIPQSARGSAAKTKY